MSEPRQLTPIESAVTDLVEKFQKLQTGLVESGKLEQLLEFVLTARELLNKSDDATLLKSQRLELIAEATSLITTMIKEFNGKYIVEGLERLRLECADRFIDITENVQIPNSTPQGNVWEEKG